MRHMTLIIAALGLAVAAPAIAGKGGNANGGNGNGSGGNHGGGDGNGTVSSASCAVSPNPVSLGESYVVSASGLPLYVALNLWVTAPSGNTTGMALGSSASGSYSLPELATSLGTWTYAFSGEEKPNMDVYATCSVVVS